ncbi:(d)CMP kinase [Rothia sp. LK2588]|uniref:(d)CMP kinase n=1 Tax=Rothia sp. LK2588 TaxID=3114369 RepID=UPI0034CD9F17
MSERIVIAIDGPSGSGKSSVSQAVARHFGLQYLDTGAMYRALTWHVLNEGIDLTDASAIVSAAQDFPLHIGTSPDREEITVNGVDVAEDIRSPRISESVSAVASVPEVRQLLIDLQRQFIAAAPKGMVAEGRDITTVVAPDADARVLLTASEEIRMARRGLQLGGTQDQAALQNQVAERDKRDSKVNNFTEAAEGVTLVDSSELDFQQTIDAVIAAVQQQLNR